MESIWEKVQSSQTKGGSQGQGSQQRVGGPPLRVGGGRSAPSVKATDRQGPPTTSVCSWGGGCVTQFRMGGRVGLGGRRPDPSLFVPNASWQEAEANEARRRKEGTKEGMKEGMKRGRKESTEPGRLISLLSRL